MCCFLSRRRNTPMPMLVKNIFLYDEARDRNEINAKRRRRCGRASDAGAVDERAYA